MHAKQPLFPLATALRAGLKDYSLKTFRADLTAGLIVSLVALPLSMALAIAVGLPPQHGLYTAIVAGIVAALLGGSPTQVSGPTAAFVVIVAPIVTQYGLHGIIWCQILAGIFLILMGVARAGKLIHFVPYPVTTGFTAGIAVTIATLALNDFLGLGIAKLSGHYVEKAATIWHALPGFTPQEALIGFATIVTIFALPKITTRIPGPVGGILLGTAISFALVKMGYSVDTLNTRFSYVAPDGTTLPGIPPYAPSFSLPGSGDLFAIPDFKELQTLLMPALVIAALGALESLLSATVADSMARTRHDPNAELNGIGIANIFSGLASGIPATGALARTAANIHAGAKTPFAAIIHALLILLYTVTLASYISYIPMAALAALLLSVAWRMSHVHQFVRIMQLAPRSDVIVLLTCFVLTVLIDMVAGVSVGMVMASLLFMTRVADATQLHVSQPGKADIAHGELPAGVMVYRIEGPLFFGSVDKMIAGADLISQDIRKLVIDLTHVPMIDMTGMMGMKTFLESVASETREVVVCGHENVTGRIRRKIAGAPYTAHVHTDETVAAALKSLKTGVFNP